MFEEQEIICIDKQGLLDKIRSVYMEGYRIVQISCTKENTYQIDYTFDKEYKFLDIRVNIPIEDAKLPSITGIYECAFAYENEIHDLFGIQIDGINLNYQGKFYRINVHAPFNIPVAQQGKPPGDKE
jgi:ech hydrogenase subunit D